MESDSKAYAELSPEALAFFTTSELVLFTLTFLPTTSLITCMRFCKDFHAKIRDGHKQKKTLFLEAAEPKATYRAPRSAIRYYANRAPKSVTTPPTEPPYITNEAASGMRQWYNLGTPNPLFSCEDHCNERLPFANIRFRMSAQTMLDHYNRLAQIYQGSIWNEMFICQPPAKVALVRFNLVWKGIAHVPVDVEWWQPDYRTMIQRVKGIRVVDVVEKMRHEIDRFEREREEKWAWNMTSSRLVAGM